MLKATDEEIEEVREYFEWPGTGRIRGCVREGTRCSVQCGRPSDRVACSQAEMFDPHGR